MVHEQAHCCDEAANHQLPIAAAFWITQIVFMDECSRLMQNLMQIHYSTHSVILNAMATQYTCSPNDFYHPHWLVQWSHHCSHMHIPVHSPCLPGYINVMQTILIILTMAEHFPDRSGFFSSGFAGVTPTRIPKRHLVRSCSAPPRFVITSELFSYERDSFIMNKSGVANDVEHSWSLCSWKVETVKNSSHLFFVRQTEISKGTSALSYWDETLSTLPHKSNETRGFADLPLKQCRPSSFPLKCSSLMNIPSIS